MSGEVDYQRIYATLNEYSSVYMKTFYNNFSIIVGLILLCTFAGLSLGKNKASYDGCISMQTPSIGILLIICNTVLFLFLFLHMIGDFIPPQFSQHIANWKVPSIFIVTLVLFCVYGVLFFSCSDPIVCKDCDSSKLTVYNKNVVNQVNNHPIIGQLLDYYNKQMNPRASIALCSNYYDASYTRERECNSSGIMPKCNTSMDTTIGAPVLSEFFIMSSYNTCFIGNDSYGYLTDKMIDVVLKAGARLLDFSIYPFDLKKNSIPIVGKNNRRDNQPIQYNYVLLEDCLRKIVTNYCTAGGPAVLKDPLFVHLNIAKNVNKGTMNNIAKMINYYFMEYSGTNYLLENTYNYKMKNMGAVPICLLFNKVIICVTCEKPLVPLLDEQVNIHFGQMFTRKYDWVAVRNYYSPRDLVDWNRIKLTYVTPTNNPYSLNNVRADDDPAPEQVFVASIPINNDPTVPLSYGCQFISMNFQNLDSDMVKYLGLFKKISYVLKPENLRRKPLKLTDTIVTATGEEYKIACDPNNSIENTNQQDSYCQSVKSQAQLNEDRAIHQQSIDQLQQVNSSSLLGLRGNPYDTSTVKKT